MVKSKYEDPYFVEVDQNGCSKCGFGRNYTIIGPDGVVLGIFYSD